MQLNAYRKNKLPRWDVLFLSAGVAFSASSACASDNDYAASDALNAREESLLSEFNEHRLPRPPREPLPCDPTIEDPFPKPRMERVDSYSVQ